MNRRALVISALSLPAVACAEWAGTADHESAPMVNISSGQAIEVPPPEQPGERAARRSADRSASAPTQNPTAPPPSMPSAETRPLVPSRPGLPTAGAKPGGPARASTDSWLGHWTVRTAAGLGVLAAMLWGLKWSAKRLGAGLGLAAQLGPAGRAPQGLLEVLGRYPVSRGHSLVLLKLDRRVLLLGQSPSGFTTLSELTDAEDVASVLTKAADADGASMSRRFSELLRGMERDPSLVDGVAASATTPLTPRLAMRLAGTGVPAEGGAP